MDNKLREIERDIEILNNWDKEAGIRDLSFEEIKQYAGAQKRTPESLRYTLDTIKEKDDAITELHKYNNRYADTIKRLTEENERLKTAHHDMSDDWVRMLKERNDAIDLLTEERDVYKKGYYKDADAVTLTVVSRLESEVKRLTEENERQDKIIRATISGEYYDQMKTLLRQKEEEIQTLNKRYLEEFEKKHD